MNDEQMADAICSLDMPTNRFMQISAPEQAKAKGLLVIQEPEVVRPLNQELIAKKLFKNYLLVGRPQKSNSIRWPALYLNRFGENSAVFKVTNRACMIASNKLSTAKGELYSLRRNLALRDSRIDLYGVGWDSKLIARLGQFVYESFTAIMAGKFPSLKGVWTFLFATYRNLGSPASKLETNRRYKASIVIENSREYMSEKLLDAISAGSIPVYVGPKVSSFSIPSNLIVEVEPSVESIARGLDIALAMDYQIWRTEADDWLSTTSVKDVWSLETHWTQIEQCLLDIAQGVDQ